MCWHSSTMATVLYNDNVLCRLTVYKVIFSALKGDILYIINPTKCRLGAPYLKEQSHHKARLKTVNGQVQTSHVLTTFNYCPPETVVKRLHKSALNYTAPINLQTRDALIYHWYWQILTLWHSSGRWFTCCVALFLHWNIPEVVAGDIPAITL